MNYTRPELAIVLEPIRKAFLDAKSRYIGLRYITEITKDNISYCKELMTIVDELRHLDRIKGNFMLSEKEYLSPVVLFEKGKVAARIIHSNVKELAEQHEYMFDTLWGKAISADRRIKEIEEGTEPIRTRLLENQHEIVREIKVLNSKANHLSICTAFGGIRFVSDRSKEKIKSSDNSNENEKESREPDYAEDEDQLEEKQEEETGEMTMNHVF